MGGDVWHVEKSVICQEKTWKNGFLKIAWAGNFLRFFFGFSQGLLIMMCRLNYRLSNSVVWEPQKFNIIQKKTYQNKKFLDEKKHFFFQIFFNLRLFRRISMTHLRLKSLLIWNSWAWIWIRMSGARFKKMIRKVTPDRIQLMFQNQNLTLEPSSGRPVYQKPSKRQILFLRNDLKEISNLILIIFKSE